MTDDRLVMVRERHLNDVSELARALMDQFPPADPLVLALRGAIGQLRADAITEP